MATGAITNIASAILREPQIIERIVIIWLGGHALHWPNTKEFNLAQDILASQLILNCGVPLVLIPCWGVTSHLSLTLSELKHFAAGKGAAGDYLVETLSTTQTKRQAWSRIIWDISASAYLINPEWVMTDIRHSPVLTKDVTWSFNENRHFFATRLWSGETQFLMICLVSWHFMRKLR